MTGPLLVIVGTALATLGAIRARAATPGTIVLGVALLALGAAVFIIEPLLDGVTP